MAFPAARTSIACTTEPVKRRLIALLLAPTLMLGPLPALAQVAAATDPELERLIPDAATVDPQAWAKGQPPAPGVDQTPLDPGSPLADLAGFTLPWPDQSLDLPAMAALTPDPDLAQAFADQPAIPTAPSQADGAITKISPQLSLVFPADKVAFPERDAIEARFRELSNVVHLAGKSDDNLAQLAVRARADRDLLQKIMRTYGYYDAEIYQTVGGIEPGKDAASAVASIRFDVLPGAHYKFGKIDLYDIASTGPDQAMLRAAFALNAGDPINSDRILEEREHLDFALGENGFAFSKLGQPDLLIDHAREEGDLTLPLVPGGKYVFGDVTSSLPQFLSGRHFAEIARFHPGDLYKRSLNEDLRRAILATGLVSSATVALRETRAPSAAEPGAVALDVTINKAPLRTIAGQIGYDSGDGFRVEASWEHRNLFPPEGALKLRAIAGTKEQLAGVTFRRNNFKGRDQVLTIDLYADNVLRDAYQARTVAFTGTFEKLTTLIFQKPWVYSVGFELLATNERQGAVNGIAASRTTYFIGALPLRAAFDGTDNLLDPTRGLRASLRVSPEFAVRQGIKAGYARVQADASYYKQLGSKVVLAGRVRLGSIPGTIIDNIAPSRRFYAGGGGSVRGFGYQAIGPKDALGNPTGGRSLTEFSLEARVKTGIFGGAISLVPFVDAGAVDQTPVPKLRDIRIGAGLGLRYQTGFGPIRVDVGTPLGRRPGESRIGVYVALGQAF